MFPIMRPTYKERYSFYNFTFRGAGEGIKGGEKVVEIDCNIPPIYPRHSGQIPHHPFESIRVRIVGSLVNVLLSAAKHRGESTC